MLAGALLAGLLLAAPARVERSPAGEELVGLSWEAPGSCPGEAQLREHVETFAPGTVDAVDASETRVRARVDESAAGFVATIEIRNPAGVSTRSFVGPDCAVVTKAVGLLMAVALDPVRSAVVVRELETAPNDEPEPEPEPNDEPEPGPEDRPEPGDEPEPEPDPEPEGDPEQPEPQPDPRLHVALRVFGMGSYGPTNAGYGGIGGGFALLGDHWRAELVGSWSIARRIPRTGVIGEVATAGIFDGWVVAGRGCYVFTPSVLELPLCPAIELGEIRGRGVPELPVALDARLVWFAVGLGQGLWYAPIERFALGIEVNAAFPVTRGAFLVDTTEVQRVPPVSVRGLFGLELRLP